MGGLLIYYPMKSRHRYRPYSCPYRKKLVFDCVCDLSVLESLYEPDVIISQQKRFRQLFRIQEFLFLSSQPGSYVVVAQVKLQT